MASAGKTYIVEHLDDELGPWSKLEYMTIAKESHDNGAKVLLSVPGKGDFFKVVSNFKK